MKKPIAWVACAGLLMLAGCASQPEKTTTTKSTTRRTEPTMPNSPDTNPMYPSANSMSAPAR